MGNNRGFRLFHRLRKARLSLRSPQVRERRLIVHIGGPKCGSSAIQSMLLANNAALVARGMLVASDTLDADSLVTFGQVGYFSQLLDHPDPVGELTRRFRELAVVMDDRQAHTLIITAENLLAPGGLASPVIQSARTAGFAPEVVAYIRRPDEQLIAGWQQWGIKLFDSPRAYWAAIASNPSRMELLGAWEQQVGIERLKVFPFRRDLFPESDVVLHFLATIGVDLPEMVRGPPVNISCNEHLSDLLNRSRDLFCGRDENDVLGHLAHVIGPTAFKSGPGSYFMSLAERHAVVERCREHDEALKARYLPQFGAEPLFPPVSPDQVVECSDIEKLRAENALLLRAIYSLSRRVTELEGARTRKTTLGLGGRFWRS
ncbi:hypothetical protein MWN33_17620 [Starkeya koreensis]|uniref:Sulfotransferase family protein n=1 Tax=Ancylobacter koreensis TaxID=266121 RepID=A0ABT0DRQ0_9HYPH|nr:hypothetical protein [Ancylobacter koreensis]MCK0209854.1 hypothetical protein [Ancylobacter koreensis]